MKLNLIKLKLQEIQVHPLLVALVVKQINSLVYGNDVLKVYVVCY